MSNRGRQNVASYLALDLNLDWRSGGEHFESMLLDYDVSSNWGNWVAAAGLTGQRVNKFNISKQSRVSGDMRQRARVCDAGVCRCTLKGRAQFGSFSASTLRASAGISVHWQAPIGPLIISLAHPFRTQQDDSHYEEKIQFTFGSQF
ncbi:MAG: hypothetical protein WDW38_007375 [Sanguina aurantia]